MFHLLPLLWSYLARATPEQYSDTKLTFSTTLDVKQRVLTVLGPSQHSYSGKTAIVGSLEWTDPL
jgi:hypothetical protein